MAPAVNGHGGAPALPPPAGIYVPVATFFAREGASNYSPTSPPCDLQTQSEHSLFLARGGVKGLVILGSTGEAVFMRKEERAELIRSQRKTLDDAGFTDRVIIAGTATQNVDDTVELITADQAAGAEFAMVLGPGYFAPATSQAGIQKWLEAVADRSPLPILIYHYPGVTNNLHISPATFEKLAAHPNIVGTKLTHGMIDDQTLIANNPRIDHEHFYVFTGLGQNLLPVLTIGGVAAIDGLAGVFPTVVVRLFDMFNQSLERGTMKQDLPAIRELQYRICEGEKLIARWGVIGVKEACARVWGLGGIGGARLPLTGGFEDGEEEWKKWSTVMDGLKTLEQKFQAEGKST